MKRLPVSFTGDFISLLFLFFVVLGIFVEVGCDVVVVPVLDNTVVTVVEVDLEVVVVADVDVVCFGVVMIIPSGTFCPTTKKSYIMRKVISNMIVTKLQAVSNCIYSQLHALYDN